MTLAKFMNKCNTFSINYKKARKRIKKVLLFYAIFNMLITIIVYGDYDEKNNFKYVNGIIAI